MGNYTEEHVCSPQDFEWIEIKPSKNPNLVSACGKLKHYGQRTAPMKLRDGRKVWITLQVCDVSIPVMSVGKFCAKGDDRRATFTKHGGILWHEEAKEIEIDRVRNHYELECWIKTARVSATVQTDDPSGGTGEPEGHHVAVPQRADAEIVMGVQPQGADAPRVDEEYIEPSTMLPEGSQMRCENKIKKHKVTQPAVPWYDMCIQSKSKNDCR